MCERRATRAEAESVYRAVRRLRDERLLYETVRATEIVWRPRWTGKEIRYPELDRLWVRLSVLGYAARPQPAEP